MERKIVVHRVSCFLPVAATALLGLAGTRPLPAQEFPNRHMFVTSASGSGNLHLWAGAGSATGLAAGDAICQSLAGAAHLDNASLYRAWLSDAANDAYCHVQGLSGKKKDRCGEDNLPIGAGPWQRVDDSPFGADIGHLGLPADEVYMPPRLDEQGHVVHGGAWTGSFDGKLFQAACNNWTSGAGADSGWYGSTDDTGTHWQFTSETTCNFTAHLYCFESGIGNPLPPVAGADRLAFVTSEIGPSGDLGSWDGADGNTGLAAGNAICRNLARAAGLPGSDSFKAWLSNGSFDARDRFDNDGPWMRVDGIRIANGLADLTDGFLRAPLNLTEKGHYRADENVWTGTNPDGAAGTGRCNNWSSSSASDQGLGGLVDAGDGDWTASSPVNGCDFSVSHLYCLQDSAVLFADGFESGDTTVWSSTQP